MSVPTLTPKSTLSAVALPATSATSRTDINTVLPYGVYTSGILQSDEFVQGANDQVAFTYKKLGGDVLDIEMTTSNVFAAYEEAVLEYSYIVNLHQATNILPHSLGNRTGSFDQDGNIMAGALSSSLSGSHVALKYPTFDYATIRRSAEGISAEVNLNASTRHSASFRVSSGQQEYDLQTIFSSVQRVAAGAAITIADVGNIDASDTISFQATDGTQITATPGATTSADDIDNPTFVIVDGDAAATAENLRSCLDANSKVTALIRAYATTTVQVTQVSRGQAGNGAIALTLATAGSITKSDFTGGSDTTSYADKIKGKKILIKRVYYKTPHAMWRFYGYYGGLNVVGNLHNYGQFSDDSTFQLIPTWHNKSQALAFEDAIYTRMSHFSYEIQNNRLRLYPTPYMHGPTLMWVEFSIPEDSWESTDPTADGVNNMNTLPLGNIPYVSINSIGKQWIRRFALSLCKETLGQVRSKFGSVPVPGDNIQLNGPALLSEAKDEQEKLRTELKETLAELTYAKMAENSGVMLENTQKALERVPNYIFVG